MRDDANLQLLDPADLPPFLNLNPEYRDQYRDGSRDRDTDREDRVAKCWLLSEPEPIRYVWQGFIPEGFVTSLFADGGTGKSFLAAALAVHIASGLSFLGADVLNGNVLVVDAEVDCAEFLRRAFSIARGLGMAKLPEGL